jgi:FkbM family methyltransferase
MLMDKLFRKLPMFKGKERLARVLFSKSIQDKKDFWIKGKNDCEYLVPNLIENIGLEIFINGVYEQDTSDFIAGKLPENGVFLDLGANIGAITIPVSFRRKDVKIVCVEAAPWIYKYLQENLTHNKVDRVYAINKVLFYTDDETLNFYSPDEKFGKGSLSPVFTNKVVSVKTVKVDTLLKEIGLPRVDLIKIDVEGYEYHVFKGATGLLGRPDAPDILFEFVDWAEKQAKGVEIGDSQQILRDLGYQIHYFREGHVAEEVKGILKEGFFMLYASKKLRPR